MNKQYVMPLSSSDAIKLRSALHIAANLISCAEYEQLRDVREFAAECHGELVALGVPLHAGVLDLERRYQTAVDAGAFKEPEPALKPEPDKWEVQIYIRTLREWRRSAVSSEMKGTSRSAAYSALRAGVPEAPVSSYRVAKVGDYKHKDGVYYLESKQKSGHASRLAFVPPLGSYREAAAAAKVLQTYADSRTTIRPVFVPTAI